MKADASFYKAMYRFHCGTCIVCTLEEVFSQCILGTSYWNKWKSLETLEALVDDKERKIKERALQLQSNGPDEYPYSYYEYIARHEYYES